MPPTKAHRFPIKRRNGQIRQMEIFVILLLAGAIFAVVVPLVLNARVQARKMSTQNNLRQLGLAFENYEATFRVLPSGSSASGLPKHSLYTRIRNFMESSSWYSQVNFELDWEHPLNQVLFFDPFPSYMRPGTPEKFTTTGYNLTHYMVNPHVFGVGSNIATEDLIGGKDHNFLVGEIAGDFVPGGYPYLWRELIWPINGSSQSYGGWADGAHFCMASGAVRFLSNETEAAALPEVVQHQSAPGTHLVPTMAREFAYSSRPRFQHLRFESETPRIHKGDWGTSIWIDRENHEAYAANLFLNAEETTASTINLDSFIRQYGATEVLQILTGEFDDSDAHSVSQLSKLRVLRVYDIELTDAGITSLQNLSQLRYFSAFMTAEEAAKLAAMLPQCEIQPRTDYRRDWMH